eukprot:TRINITY_DN915_c0_g1_i2.p1 TRINITY_DN915_c0_g1~~TRINITY_DN915_c0_g1_i2.p1  ORF type:complete len:167 (-),score=62.90 TRINITY_DN915_c0_g1_i2:355-789(-)
MALVVDEKKFQYILRIFNTNVNGKDKVMYALTRIRGVGRRFANLVCKKAEIDMKMRAGELTEEQIETIRTIIEKPTQFDIPVWFLNRRKDIQTGKNTQLTSNHIDTKLRDDLERMKKIRSVVVQIFRFCTIISSHFSALSTSFI